jgi:osmotically-inducible protein OsmY
MIHARIILAAVLSASLTGCVGVSLNTEERSFGDAVGDVNARTGLNARLLAEGPALFANVATSVIEGRVHLSGTVPTNDDRLTATRIAWGTPNIKEVVNDIEVTNEGDLLDTVRDRWINTQVRARILSDGAIKDINYTINTQNRTIFILGIAQDQAELDRVLAHARSIPEARRVVNYALLKDDPQRFAWPGENANAEVAEAPSEQVLEQ